MTNAMQTSGTSPVFKAAEAFMPQVEGKLHAWVEVEVEGIGKLCNPVINREDRHAD